MVPVLAGSRNLHRLNAARWLNDEGQICGDGVKFSGVFVRAHACA